LGKTCYGIEKNFKNSEFFKECIEEIMSKKSKEKEEVFWDQLKSKYMDD